ncbi:MAG: FtsL-like putative cell division protein [Saprospiraceae bacterium]|nr:FtsL-like putative cell division protein [Saprospiraceae bacterium]
MKRDHLNINGTDRKRDLRDLGSKWIAKNLAYLYFLIFLAMLYIANAHYTEKKLRKIDSLNKELRELNWNYMSLKSEVIYQGTYTKLGKDVSVQQLTNQGEPPRFISSRKKK